MLDESKSVEAGKSYKMGNVGPYSKVQQGENLWIETVSAIPDSNALVQQFKNLIEQISKDNTLDDDTRDVSVKKVEAVAEGLAKAQKSDGRGLKKALLDAKSWFAGNAGWVWTKLDDILKSEAAQKTIWTITESTVRGSINGLTGTT